MKNLKAARGDLCFSNSIYKILDKLYKLIKVIVVIAHNHNLEEVDGRLLGIYDSKLTTSEAKYFFYVKKNNILKECEENYIEISGKIRWSKRITTVKLLKNVLNAKNYYAFFCRFYMKV